MATEELVFLDELQAANDAIKPGTDTVLLSFDWRVEELTVEGKQTRRHYYLRNFLSQYLAFIKLMGLAALVALPDQPVGDYRANVVGLILAGGRDMHPRFYGQAVNGTHLNPASETRFPWALEQYK